MGKLLLGLVTACLLLSFAAGADEMIAPRRYKDLEGVPQTHVFVPGTTVAYANYRRLREKFPELARWTEEAIDEWLIENFAYISESQLRLRGIRTSDFAVDEAKTRKFIHPRSYRRASMAAAKVDGKTVGLVDLKGTGFAKEDEPRRDSVDEQTRRFEEIQKITDPSEREKALAELRTKDHSDGVATLGEGIAELTRQAAIQASYDLYNAEHATSYQTDEVLFLLAYPATALKPGREETLCAIGREAGWRGSPNLKSPNDIYFDNFGGRQSTRFDSAIDFGGALIADPALVATFGDFKTDDPKVFVDPQSTNAWRYGHETAAAYVAQVKTDPKAAHDLVRRHLEEMLSPLAGRLAALPRLSPEERWERYIIHRLSVRDDNAQATIAEKFLRFPTEKIEANLGRLLSQKDSAQNLIVPVIKELLKRPGYEKKSAKRRDLLSRVQRFYEKYDEYAYIGPALPKLLKKKFDGVFACSAVF